MPLDAVVLVLGTARDDSPLTVLKCIHVYLCPLLHFSFCAEPLHFEPDAVIGYLLAVRPEASGEACAQAHRPRVRHGRVLDHKQGHRGECGGNCTIKLHVAGLMLRIPSSIGSQDRLDVAGFPSPLGLGNSTAEIRWPFVGLMPPFSCFPLQSNSAAHLFRPLLRGDGREHHQAHARVAPLPGRGRNPRLRGRG